MPAGGVRDFRFAGGEPGVDIDIREDDETGVAGGDIEGNRHENRDVPEGRIDQGAELQRRLDFRGPAVRIEGKHLARQGAVQGGEDLLLQRLTGFMGKRIGHR